MGNWKYTFLSSKMDLYTNYFGCVFTNCAMEVYSFGLRRAGYVEIWWKCYSNMHK